MDSFTYWSGNTLRSPEWHRSATRWTQVTFVENDPDTYDPDFWIDIFQQTRSNAACLSAGGYMAFYPSKLESQYVSRHLNGRDIFGELVEGARRLGMHVMARVDPHAIRQEIAEKNPGWVQVRSDGTPFRHWAFAEAFVVNAYGSYARSFMPDLIREIADDYDIDAIFANRWQGHGIDYSEDSARRFRDATGYELPLAQDPADPAWQAWLLWRRRVLTDTIAHWDDVIKASRQHACFIPNMEGSSLMEFDIAVVERYCPFFVADHQGRRGVELGWSGGRNGKRMRATFPDRPNVLISSIGPEEKYRWKDSVNTPEEIQLWVNSGTCQGMRAWFTKFSGQVGDRRWIQPIVESFGVHARVEKAIESTSPASEVALIDPSTTLRHWPSEERAQGESHEFGFYHALIESRLSFEMLSDQRLAADELDHFGVIVMANASCLSDAQCEAIRRYVARGGSLVAAYETSLRDEFGNLRQDFGLADVFRARFKSASEPNLQNSYLALEGAHPINDGYEGAGRIIGGTRQIEVEAAEGALTPFLYVPRFPDLPMEEVYARESPAVAAVLAHETPAGGRIVYIPWNIGETFWEVLAADHGRLIGNAVRWALGKAPRVQVEGAGVVEVAARENGNGILITLLNLTNPMMMKGPIRETFPLPEQKVSVEVPRGRQVARANFLVSERECTVHMDGDRAIVVVPSFERVEMIQLLWA